MYLVLGFRRLARLLGTVVVACSLTASANAQFRTIDGSDNNASHPEYGMAGIPLLRKTTISYTDGFSSPAGASRPSARIVSNAISAQSAPTEAGGKASAFVWQWGQFLDHDMSMTGMAAPGESLGIPVPAGDPYFDPFATGFQVIPFSRSLYVLDGSGVRQQMNEITAWIDGSMVYGSDLPRSLALRERFGRLVSSPGGLLPFNRDGFPNDGGPSPLLFLAGDVRANEQLGLTAMHTLFMREHNWWARIIRQFLGAGDDVVYHLARRMVGAEIQAITYNEFLPVILGPNALAPYKGYDPGVDPGISNAFSTAAYRFGHTMLGEELLRLDENLKEIPAGHIPLAGAFFNPSEIVAYGIDPLLRGLAMQRAERVDTLLIDSVRNFLFGPPGSGGFDLAALNIQRGRDHGLPSYNQMRVDVGLAPKASFSSITSDARAAAVLETLYGSVDEIDAWVGILAEDHVAGGMVGELARTVLIDQFERLRDGDSFWYQYWMGSGLIRMTEFQTLSRIIRRNTSIRTELPDNVFRAPNRAF